jgi:hypothetical protein
MWAAGLSLDSDARLGWKSAVNHQWTSSGDVAGTYCHSAQVAEASTNQLLHQSVRPLTTTPVEADIAAWLCRNWST